MSNDRLHRDRLVTEAVDRVDRDDFGEPRWQEGLDLLVEGLRSEAKLHDLGVEIAAGDIVNQLANRLGIVEWRRRHPEITAVGIRQPIVIVGQPRTGTTILHDILAVDADNKAPMTWEAMFPSPPPEAGCSTKP